MVTGTKTHQSNLSVPSLTAAIARMKDEIIQDVTQGRVTASVMSFAALHDYVDANEYGGFCDDDLADAMIAHFGGRDEHEGMPQAMLDYINAAQEAIDEWLRSGGLLNAEKCSED